MRYGDKILIGLKSNAFQFHETSYYDVRSTTGYICTNWELRRFRLAVSFVPKFPGG